MSETTVSEGTSTSAERPVSIVWFALGGAAIGALIGALQSALEYFVRGRSLRDVSLTTFLIVYPVVFAIIGSATRRSPPARLWKRPTEFFATEPLSAEENEVRGRRVRKSVWTGFGTGIVVGAMASVLDFAWRGWPYVSEMLGLSLFLFPYFGAILGFNMGSRPGDPKPSLRDIRFRMRTLMILTAYFAICLAVAVQTSRVSGAAKIYHFKARDAVTTAGVFQGILDQQIADLGRKRNAEELRAGRIPEGIDKSQKDFLRSLDQTATEEYKKYRYGLIADGEQRLAEIALSNVDVYSRIVDYFKKLAEKYEKARLEPWLPVEPDPPMPGASAPATTPPPGAGTPGSR
ncbi:MAG: magnesium transporter [Paludisphaera borealis]|uniref:magnesium transporter n=1 Tax=Paludisphaera borealis TaxID=1387353 RepID=UPI002847F2B6|nr:magnesium transporter [Paludisphaera borealis]MDR3617779.1 magnesium transporter [Paludisphaera borealis]